MGSSINHHGNILYGTVQGAIGLVTQLRPQFFSFLQDLQNRMRNKIRSVGKIQHKDWRSFYNERKTEPMEDIVSGMQMPDEGSGMKTDAKVEDIIKIVEDL